MDANLKYKEVQKQITSFLKQFGFKKVKSMFVLDLPEAYVYTAFGRPASLRMPGLVVWQMTTRLRFKLLDSVFRPDSAHLFEFGLEDMALGGDMNAYSQIAREFLFTIDDMTAIDSQVAEYINLVKPNLELLPEIATIEHRLKITTDSFRSGISPHSGSMVRLAVMSKLLGHNDLYEEVHAKLRERHDYNAWFVQDKLERLEKIVKEQASKTQLAQNNLNKPSRQN